MTPVGLAHELFHAYRDEVGLALSNRDLEEEETIGIGEEKKNPTENDIRDELGEPMRPRYRF